MKLLYIQTHLIIFWDSNKEREENRFHLADVLTFVTDSNVALWQCDRNIHGLAGARHLLLGMHCLAAAVSSDVGMTPRDQISSYATSRNGGCWWDTAES